MRAQKSATPTPVPPLVEQGVNALRGRGRPLTEPARQSLERRTGSRLAHVRVHDDPLAHALTAAVGARAFNAGSDIALGASADAPAALGHELAHAAQQSGTPAGGPLAVTQPGDAIEQGVT